MKNNMKSLLKKYVYLIVLSLLLSVGVMAQTTYYYVSGNAQTASSWNTNPAGGGTAATNFTTNNTIFNVPVGKTAAFTANTTFGSATAAVTLDVGGSITIGNPRTLTIGVSGAQSIVIFRNTGATQASGAGGFTLAAGCKLVTYNSAGIDGVANSSINSITGTVTLSTTADYEFPDGSQTTTGLPATVRNLIFSGTGTKTLAAAVTVSTGLTVDEVTVNLSNFNMSSAATTLYTGAAAQSIITSSGSGILTLAGNVTVTNAATGTNGATISCPITLSATRTFTVNNNSNTVTDLLVSGAMSGATFGFQKAGTGKMMVSGNSSYTGTTTIAAGILMLGGAGSGANSPLGTIGGITSITSGATLDLNGFSLVTAEPLTLNGTGYNPGSGALGALTNSTSTSATYSGLLTLGSASTVLASNGTIILSATGTISGATFRLTLDGSATACSLASIIGNTTGGVTKNGSGTWILSGTSTYSGTTIISAGTLRANNSVVALTNGAFGNSAAAVQLNGGTLEVNNATFSRAISLTGNSRIDAYGSARTVSAAISATGAFALSVGGTTAASAEGQVLTLSGVLSSSMSVIKTLSSTVVLTNTNTYTGNTIISAGTLRAGNSVATSTNGAFGNSAPAVQLNGGALEFNNATFSRPLSVTANGSRIDAYGANRTISANLSATGTFTLSVGGTFAVNAEGQQLTLSGAISNGSGLLTIDKTGTSTLVFGGTVSIKTITVSAGTLNPGAGTINLAGDFTVTTGSISGNVFTATLNFNGTSGDQAFNPGTGITYTAVTVNNTTGTVSIGANTTINALTIASSAIFSDNGNTITGGSGALTVNGTLKLGSSFPSFASTSLGNTSTVEYTSNGTQTILAKNYANLTSSGSGSRTMEAGTIGISGVFTPGINSYSAADATSTIDFNGTGAQTIESFGYYNNLTISGSRGGATVTLGSSITIGGDFSPSATSVSYTTTGSTVTFSGSAFQNINNPFNFNSLTINATAPVLLNADISTSATGTLTLSAGHLVLNGNTYTINGTSLVSGGGDIDATMVTPSTIKCSHTGILTLPYDVVSAGMWNLTVDQGGTVALSGLTIQTFSIGGVLSLTNNSKIELLNDTKLQLDGSVSMGSGASPTGFIKGNPQARMAIAGSGAAGDVGTLYFDPATDRSTNSINEFVIATASGGRSVTLGNKLNIITLFTPLNDIDPLKNVFTFNSKGFLTMRSSSKWTASVNRVGSGFTFADSVVVERYVTGKTVRRYISVGPPVNGATIRTAWQDSIFITAPGTGGTICGSTSGNGGTTDKYNSNGYDATTANLYTIQSYEQSGVNAGAFQNIGTNTTTTTLTSGKGYKVLYRGPRFKNSDGSSNCTALLNTGGTGIVADTVTMTAKAFLTTGDVTVSLNSKPTASSYGYTFLSNPYACQLDFSQFYANNTASGMNQGFWINDPNGYSNGYVTIKYTGSWVMVGKNPSSPNFTTSASELPYIASGQAFFVSTANTSNLAVTFKEDYKVIPTVQQIGAFRSSGTQSMVDDNRIRAYFLNADSSYIDDVLVLFSDDPTVSKNFDDKFDAVSLNSGTFLTTVKGTKACAIQTRPIGFYNDTVAMRIVSASTGNFLFNFTEYQNFDSADQIILLDLYNNTQTDVKSNPYFNFSITSDAATQGANRFKLVFRSQASVLPVSFLGISATQKQTGVEVAWRLAFEQNIQSYNVQRSDNGRDFYSLSSVKSKGNSSAPVEYTYMDQKPVSAVAYYRIKSIDVAGEEKFSAVVKINSSKESLISLYPNPVKDQLKVVTANLSLDKATAEIRNVQGKTVFQQVLRGSNGNYSIDVSNLASGLYILTITTGDGNRMMEKFMKY